MKTIVHIELSDEERNDLAKRIYRDADTKVLVTRKEVTELVLALVQQEVNEGREQEFEEFREELSDATEQLQERTGSDKVCPGTGKRSDAGGHPEEIGIAFAPSRGDEGYLAQPKDPGLAAACSRILDDAKLIENFAWDTIERNRRT